MPLSRTGGCDCDSAACPEWLCRNSLCKLCGEARWQKLRLSVQMAQHCHDGLCTPAALNLQHPQRSYAHLKILILCLTTKAASPATWSDEYGAGSDSNMTPVILRTDMTGRSTVESQGAVDDAFLTTWMLGAAEPSQAGVGRHEIVPLSVLVQ